VREFVRDRHRTDRAQVDRAFLDDEESAGGIGQLSTPATMRRSTGERSPKRSPSPSTVMRTPARSATADAPGPKRRITASTAAAFGGAASIIRPTILEAHFTAMFELLPYVGRPRTSRNLMMYFVAFLMGDGASQVQMVAVSWTVYGIHHRAFDLGLVGLVMFVPSLLLVFVAATPSIVIIARRSSSRRPSLKPSPRSSSRASR